MKDILKLVHVDNEKVVVQFKENLSNLDKALNPWILPNADYVTISRGKNHIMRVITKDGNSWSIKWGDSGYTLISSPLPLNSVTISLDKNLELLPVTYTSMLLIRSRLFSTSSNRGINCTSSKSR